MEMKLCPTCSQPCEYKNGIMCTNYVCYKRDVASGKVPVGNSGLDKILSVFGMTSNHPNYSDFMRGFNNNQYERK